MKLNRERTFPSVGFVEHDRTLGGPVVVHGAVDNEADTDVVPTEGAFVTEGGSVVTGGVTDSPLVVTDPVGCGPVDTASANGMPNSPKPDSTTPPPKSFEPVVNIVNENQLMSYTIVTFTFINTMCDLV